MLEVVKYNESYKRDLIKVSVKDHQKTFVSTIEDILKKYESTPTAELLVYLHNGKVIGLCLYRVNEEFENVFIWQMIVDEKTQGMGFGRTLLIKVEKYIMEHENYSKIITTVKEDNDASCMLFVTQGYTEMSYDEDEINYLKSL